MRAGSPNKETGERESTGSKARTHRAVTRTDKSPATRTKDAFVGTVEHGVKRRGTLAGSGTGGERAADSRLMRTAAAGDDSGGSDYDLADLEVEDSIEALRERQAGLDAENAAQRLAAEQKRERQKAMLKAQMQRNLADRTVMMGGSYTYASTGEAVRVNKVNCDGLN